MGCRAPLPRLLVRNGSPPGGVLAVDSPLRSGLGLLIWGVPLLVFALSGRSARERAEAEGQESPQAPASATSE